jgi:hypothetical protein
MPKVVVPVRKLTSGCVSPKQQNAATNKRKEAAKQKIFAQHRDEDVRMKQFSLSLTD